MQDDEGSVGDEGADKEPELEPEQVVDAAAVDGDSPDTSDGTTRRRAPAVARPYPRRPLEDAIKVPNAIRTGNNGKPWPPDQVAKALGMGTGSSFFYLAQASRDFGLTEGGRDAATISLTDLGRQLVFPNTPQDATDAKLQAFKNVEKFRKVAEHYGGSNLPADEFVRNTLQTQYQLDVRVHDEFIELFKANCRYVGIGAEWGNGATTLTHSAARPTTQSLPTTNGTKPAISVGQPPSAAPTGDAERPVCFVIMPFVERTDVYATGFFTEVFASLFAPALEAAVFEPRTAKRQGSDVIQATIINELYDADLVLCDLTEHNPNVLFELGVRMASELPIALVKATGTNPIFDVDQMLRVESYNPNMWPSTVKADVPKLAAHIIESYANREVSASYISILRRVSATA